MKPQLNETHDASVLSWVDSANTGNTDFPIQNWPYGVFRRAGSDEQFRLGVAIGDRILDLAAARVAGIFSALENKEFDKAILADKLNGLMNLGNAVWPQLRLALSRALREGASVQAALQSCLL
ncbi:MAG: fumarylacetoacetase, partial [Burkholderiales bacterium]|nr:fumarylacetoacetase [Burkholderiales bacterium]